MDKVLEVILAYGLLPTFLLILIFLIVQDPNRAFKLKSLLIYPFFKIFHWFKREYVASEVSRYLNTFFKKELNPAKGDEASFKISWVKSDADPILKNGKVVIRMRRDDDQTKNILTAARYALPKMVCPLFRHNITTSYATAIDLTFLHKFAEQLGNHGKAVFRKYFLNPEVDGDQTLIETLQRLHRIDNFGVFTTIFINELEFVGEGIFADGDHKDRTSELIQFLNYLNTLAEREIGEELGDRLVNFSEKFRVGIILLAKSQIANKKGLLPYLRRLNINLERGCDSIYIIAFEPAFQFLEKFIQVVDGNQRVTIEKVFRRKHQTNSYDRQYSINICCLRRNKLFTNESFVKKVQANDIKAGRYVEGVVVDASEDEALISFLGVDGTIRKLDCSWVTFLNCNQVLSEGDTKTFMVKGIDTSNGNISLTLKFPLEEDPWRKVQIPKVSDIISVYVAAMDGVGLKCIYEGLLEISVPATELSWFGMTHDEKAALLRNNIEVKVMMVDADNRLIECSIRELSSNPWPAIHQAFKPGKVCKGKVLEVTEHFVRVTIDNGLVGKIPKENLLNAGHEYARFRETMVPGQGVDVVVTKVFISKKWIRLDLKRNLVPAT